MPVHQIASSLTLGIDSNLWNIRTNIELNELKRIMQSLSSAKQKFLRKSKDGEGPESYSYNLKFASKSKKVFVI